MLVEAQMIQVIMSQEILLRGAEIILIIWVLRIGFLVLRRPWISTSAVWQEARAGKLDVASESHGVEVQEALNGLTYADGSSLEEFLDLVFAFLRYVEMLLGLHDVFQEEIFGMKASWYSMETPTRYIIYILVIRLYLRVTEDG